MNTETGNSMENSKTREIVVDLPYDRLHDIEYIDKLILTVGLDTLYHISNNSSLDFVYLVKKLIPNLDKIGDDVLSRWNLTRDMLDLSIETPVSNNIPTELREKSVIKPDNETNKPVKVKISKKKLIKSKSNV